MEKPTLKIRPFANPFYTLLLVVGVIFLISVCAFGVLTVKMMSPESAGEILAAESGIMYWLDQYGVIILLAELAVLGVLVVAAMASDDYWQKRAASAAGETETEDSKPSS